MPRGKKPLNLVGQRFGRLLVVSYYGRRNTKHAWNCQCDCGNQHIANTMNLRHGDTTSCGCYREEFSSTINLKHGACRVGKTEPEYDIWCAVIQRCTNPNTKQWKDYGGRGITICDEWRESYQAFINDVGKRPSRYHSLERDNNNLGYNVENCRWATRKEQNNNRRNNTLITYNGRTQNLQQWADEIGVSSSLLCQRLGRLGWTLEESLGIVPRVNGNTSAKLTITAKRIRWNARAAVNRRVQAGILPHPTTLPCHDCGQPASHYHHHRGYEKPHHIDVVPICTTCHGKYPRGSGDG